MRRKTKYSHLKMNRKDLVTILVLVVAFVFILGAAEKVRAEDLSLICLTWLQFKRLKK